MSSDLACLVILASLEINLSMARAFSPLRGSKGPPQSCSMTRDAPMARDAPMRKCAPKTGDAPMTRDAQITRDATMYKYDPKGKVVSLNLDLINSRFAK